MQEEDAARRTAILRGDIPPALPSPPPQPESTKRTRDGADDHGRSERKRMRRQRGEDDTDRDIRVAKSDVDAGQNARTALSGVEETQKDVSVTDHAGHINLFPAPDVKDIRKAEKNAEAEAEKAKKQRQLEDQYTMRFSNAAGFKQSLENPWYAADGQSRDAKSTVVEQPTKDVWGNEDPRKKERDQTRTSASDPMAFMQRAQKQLKQSEQDRNAWKASREKELRDLVAQQEKEESRHRARRKHRDRNKDVDILEGFSLDGPDESRHRRHSADLRHKHQHEHGHRSTRRGRSDRSIQRLHEDDRYRR